VWFHKIFSDPSDHLLFIKIKFKIYCCHKLFIVFAFHFTNYKTSRG
jgi:hypothetical protein